MKKLMLLGAVAALAASALPGAAAAGRFTGVVVAKDSARHTVAVVIGKQVRTVRTAKLGGLVHRRRRRWTACSATASSSWCSCARRPPGQPLHRRAGPDRQAHRHVGDGQHRERVAALRRRHRSSLDSGRARLRVRVHGVRAALRGARPHGRRRARMPALRRHERPPPALRLRRSRRVEPAELRADGGRRRLLRRLVRLRSLDRP